MKLKLFIIALSVFAISCKSAGQHNENAATEKTEEDGEVEKSFVSSSGEEIEKIYKSEEEWKSMLTDRQFQVLRKKGTERAFTGSLLNNKKEGIYTCAACGLPLFDSKAKYNSGSGWPSYFQPLDEAFIDKDVDYNIGYARTEIMCKRCGGHLGHVFEDGPKPTGLRYCVNSASLGFVERDSVSSKIEVKFENKQ